MRASAAAQPAAPAPAPAAPAAAPTQQKDVLAELVGPDGKTPIRQAASNQSRPSGSGSGSGNAGGSGNGGGSGGGAGGSGGGNGGPVNPAGAGGSGGGSASGSSGSGNSGGGGSTNSPGNTPTNSNIQGPQGSAPTSGSNNGGNGGSAGATPAPSQAPQSSSPASSATPAAPSTSTPNQPQPQSQPQSNIQVNIIADLQELQKVKQQLADYIRQAASLNLKQEIDGLNQQVEQAIKKVQSGIPKDIDPTELAAKITSITRAQYNIGERVSKLGPQAGSKDPEISSHIQSIKNALDEINQYYQHSSSNNFGN